MGERKTEVCTNPATLRTKFDINYLEVVRSKLAPDTFFCILLRRSRAGSRHLIDLFQKSASVGGWLVRVARAEHGGRAWASDVLRNPKTRKTRNLLGVCPNPVFSRLSGPDEAGEIGEYVNTSRLCERPPGKLACSTRFSKQRF